MYVARDHRTIRKRKRGERVFAFQIFGDPGFPADYDGPFRDNVRVFLEKCAEAEVCMSVDGMPAWSIALEDDSSSVQGGGSSAQATRINLLVFQESITDTLHPHCDQCRCIGWSHHPVSNMRYHFIIPAPEQTSDRSLRLAGMNLGHGGAKAQLQCPSCNEPIVTRFLRCPSCGEEPGLMGRFLDLQSHLLHGVIHCNGFGHLLRINGREKGSNFASGREIMDLWDRICAMLRARKVSVEDVSKKCSLELRLLHAVAYGESWYGRWGYKFGHGSFGITQQMYVKAIEAIREMPLTVMAQHFEGVDQEVPAIIATYQRISGQNLQTVGDFIRFMMELKVRLPVYSNNTKSSISCKDYDKKASAASAAAAASNTTSSAAAAAPTTTTTTTQASEMPCRWSAKRLDLATQVIVEALKSCERKWMPRQDVRDAARVYIGDTGLLDFVLKSLGNRVVGNHVVRRAVNPITKVLEYSLEDAVSYSSSHSSAAAAAAATLIRPDGRSSPGQQQPQLELLPGATVYELGRTEVLKDIVYIYKHVLENYKPARRGMKNLLTAIPTAAKIILDTKQFIKDYRGEITRKSANNDWNMDDDEMLRVMCTVVLKDEDPTRNRPSPPPELVVLPPHATVRDLKMEAQRAFRETYYIMHSFCVESIPEMDSGAGGGSGDDEDDDQLLFGAIESGSHVFVDGSGIDACHAWRYEGGIDSWIVDCPCGTKDDDGERMIACDLCEVWQHTRCGGISDMDAIPQRFLCHRCGVNLFHAML